MTRFRLRRKRAVALALSAGVLAVAAPTAAAKTLYEQPPPPPSSIAASAAGDYQDLRSPDARDATAAGQQQSQSGVAYTDLRSPDARDAALGTTTGAQATPTPTTVETRRVIAVEESGDQTLAIVFSSIALAIALLAVGFVAVTRRPRPRWTAP